MDDAGKERDQELINRFKEGRTEAFDELVGLHASKLFQTAYGLLGSRQDAEEVVQDAFVRAYKGLDEFRCDASFETWMHRIVLNLARNKYHWNRRRGEGLHTSINERARQSVLSESNMTTQDIPLPDNTYGPDKAMENRELEKNVMRGLECLPDTLREAMILRHVKDLPYENIAEILGCKIGTVKSRLARGREFLKDFLGKLDEGLKVTFKPQDAHAD